MHYNFAFLFPKKNPCVCIVKYINILVLHDNFSESFLYKCKNWKYPNVPTYIPTAPQDKRRNVTLLYYTYDHKEDAHYTSISLVIVSSMVCTVAELETYEGRWAPIDLMGWRWLLIVWKRVASDNEPWIVIVKLTPCWTVTAWK